jgi:RNA polymerase sigma factor (sigma-70 family)
MMNQKMNQNSELVLETARQYEGRNGLSLDELIAAGNIGLREAIKRFDPEREEKLSVFAQRWIERSIKKALQLGRAPTAKEISSLYPKHSHLPPEADDEADDEGTDTHDARDRRESSYGPALSPVSIDDDTREAFMCVLAEAGLDSREQKVIALRYGMFGGVPKTHRQIGEELRLTRSRISQIEKATREKLERL